MRGARGFSLIVNEWQTSDQQLIVEWGDVDSGCRKLGSAPAGARVEYDRWTHVAAALGHGGSAALYIDGVAAGRSDPTGQERRAQRERSARVGMYADGMYPFIGNVSGLLVLEARDATRAALVAAQRALSRARDSRAPQGELSQADVAALARGTAPGARAPPTAAIASGAPFAQAHGAIAAFALTEAGRERPGSVALNSAPPEHRAPGVARFTFPAPGLTMEGANGLPVVRGELVIGYTPREVTKEEEARSDEQSARWAEDVRNAMRHAWSGYRTYAWGRDELKPQSKVGADPWGGIGCTLVDALDTLWLMGLRSEFEEAARWAKEKLTFAHAGTVSTFETTIRELGGLLAAHDLSGDAGLLARARGDRLEARARLRRRHDAERAGRPALGPRRRARLVGRERGARRGRHAPGRVPVPRGEDGQGRVRGQGEPRLRGPQPAAPGARAVPDLRAQRRRHERPGHVRRARRQLLRVPPQDVDPGRQGRDAPAPHVRRRDGRRRLRAAPALEPERARVPRRLRRRAHRAQDGPPRVLHRGHARARRAHESPDGLRSARARARPARRQGGVLHVLRDVRAHADGNRARVRHVQQERRRRRRRLLAGASAGFYILRPETVESLFVLHQLTRDPIYREWSRKIFEAIEKHCKTSVGYGALPDVRSSNRRPDDRMESFFLAETLKYLYLIQDPHHPIDIVNGYVFNTEAHPLRILGGSGVHISQQLSAG